MKTELTVEQLENYIEELLDWDALEIQIREGQDAAVLFPYLMNDAAEYYIRLEDCRIRGSWCGDKKGVLAVSFEEESGKSTVRIEQNDGTTLEIGYRKAWKEEHCYQYHRIGHSWRKEPGQERIRRLVNLLCVLHDKCSFLGEEAATEGERFLAALIEFQPLCYWTPINSSIEEWYPETMDGILTMKELVSEAGDRDYLELLCRYELFWENFDEEQTGRRMQKQLFRLRDLQDSLARALVMPEHAGITALLEEKIEAASLHWNPRPYSREQEEAMEKLRREKEREYREKCYTGTYPRMQKTEPLSGERREVFFVEEQPFTELEWSDYQFRIYEIFS